MPVLKPEEAVQIGGEEEQARALFEEKEAERLFSLRQQERQGMIRRTPYTSSGVGALAGATVGGVAGTVAGGPVGGTLGAVAGAGLGESAEQAYTALSGPSPTLKESLQNLGEQVGAAAVGEGAGAALRFIRPLKYAQARPLTPEQLTRQRTLDAYHIPYLATEITDSGLHKFLSDLGEFGIFSPPAFAETREVQAAQQKLAIRSVADSIGREIPPHELGVAVANLIEKERDLALTNAGVMYNGIRDKLTYTTKDIPVNTGRFIPHPSGLVGPDGKPVMVAEQVAKSVSEGGLLANITPTTSLFAKELKALDETAKTNPAVANVLKNDPFYDTARKYALGEDPVQWNEGHDLLKSIRRQIRLVEKSPLAATETGKMVDIGTLTKIESQLEDDLGKALDNSVNPEHRPLLTQWKAAQDFVKERAEVLRNQTVSQLVRTVDEKGGDVGVAQFINSLSADNTQKVLTAVAKEPDLQNSLRRAFVVQGLERAGGGNADPLQLVNPKQFRDYIFGKTTLTQGKSNVLLTAPQQQALGDLTNAIEQQQVQMKPGKLGTMFMAMKTSGAVFTIAGGAAGLVVGGTVAPVSTTLGAVTILAGPKLLGDWLLKPETTKLLVQGLRYSGSQTKVGQVVRELARVDSNFARVVQLSVSQAAIGAQVGGPPARTAETTQLQSVNALPSAFPLEK